MVYNHCVGIYVSLLVIVNEMLDFRGKVRKAMADYPFAFSIVHPFVLMVIQAMLMDVRLHAPIKFVCLWR